MALPDIDMRKKILKREVDGAVESIDYQPGNATRYDVIWIDSRKIPIRKEHVLVLLNFGRSMRVPVGISLFDPGYVADKLDVSLGDANALAELISFLVRFPIDRMGQPCRSCWRNIDGFPHEIFPRTTIRQTLCSTCGRDD